MRNLVLIIALAGFLPVARAAKTLDMYFIDVEGGQATLIVTPSKQSLLVDAGWPGFNARDANRIVAAAKAAGVKRIDYFVATHYHTDHVGGVPEVSERLPIRTFVDHGPSVESGPNQDRLFNAYAAARAKGKHLQVKPGDSVPVNSWPVVSPPMPARLNCTAPPAVVDVVADPSTISRSVVTPAEVDSDTDA